MEQFDFGPASGQNIPGKADKVTSATSGHFAGLDANGNLTDSGKKASDFLTDTIYDVIEVTISNNSDTDAELGSGGVSFLKNYSHVYVSEYYIGNPSAFASDIEVSFTNDGYYIGATIRAYSSSTVKIIVCNRKGSTETPQYITTNYQKADRVSDATSNMIAGLNSQGNLVSTPFTVSNGKLCISYQKEVEE